MDVHHSIIMDRKHLVIPILATIVLAAQSWADFESAAEVYRQRDYTSAFSLFLPLAEKGDPRAQTVIAMMYKYGEATKQDEMESFKWYGKAADQGYAPAQYQVGEMYTEGVGVEIDPAQAIIWLSKAADSGFAKADDKLAELKTSLTGSEKNEPKALTQPWHLRLRDDIRYGTAVARINATDRNSDLNIREIFRVQLGAMKSLASANRLWNAIRDPNRDLFEGLEPIYKSTMPGTRVLYRLQTGSFDSLVTAKQFCDQLIDRGVTTGCLPVQPPTDSNS